MNRYWFLDKSRFVGYTYTVATTIPCALIDAGIALLFVWWLQGVGIVGSIGIVLLYAIIGVVLNAIVGYFWALHIIAPSAWMVRRRGLYRRVNSGLIIFVYFIAMVAALTVQNIQGWTGFAPYLCMVIMFQRCFLMAKLQFKRACCMCVEEYQLSPELYNDVEIEPKAFLIYYTEKAGGEFRL